MRFTTGASAFRVLPEVVITVPTVNLPGVQKHSIAKIMSGAFVAFLYTPFIVMNADMLISATGIY